MRRGDASGYTAVMSGSDAISKKPWEHAKQGAALDAADRLAVERFVESLDVDRRLFEYDIQGSVAHARMLCATGLLTDDERRRIEEGLAEIRAEIEAEGDAWSGWKHALEDVHMCIEAALVEKVGDAGRKLHTGRSRNDQVALDLKLWIVDAVRCVDTELLGVLRAFLAVAERDGAMLFPAYTHLQRAQPIVLGAELTAWMAALDRARQRLALLRDLNADNPLGAGAIAGTGLPIDRRHTAAALPLAGPSGNALDATATRDAGIDFAYGLTMVAMTLSRWAEQWILYCSSEFALLQLDHAYTTGSSMMPQKRNPDILELVRGHSGGVYGALVALLTICKGLTVGYNRDLQLDKRHLFAAYDSVMACLGMVRRIVATARFDPQRARAALETGFVDATALADYLVTKGVPFRTAHQIVGGLVSDGERAGHGDLAASTVDAVNDACDAAGVGRPCGEDMGDWLGADNVVRRYCSEGNAGSHGLQSALEDWTRRLIEES